MPGASIGGDPTDGDAGDLANAGICDIPGGDAGIGAESAGHGRYFATRTQGRRNAEARKSALRTALCSGRLGHHRGVPVSIVVTDIDSLTLACQRHRQLVGHGPDGWATTRCGADTTTR